MTREQVEQLILAVVGGAALLVGAYYLALQPQMKKLRQMEADGTRVAQALAEAERKVQSIPRVKARCRSLEQYVMEAESELLGDGSFDAYLGILKATADAAGVTLQYVRPREVQAVIHHGEQYEEQVIVVDTRAPYHGIGAWLAGLEGTSRFVRVHAVSVVGGNEGIHNASVTVGFLGKRRK